MAEIQLSSELFQDIQQAVERQEPGADIGRVLQYLAANAGRPVPREELLSKVWGYARNLDIETRTVDIHIAKLRRKIEPDPGTPRYLVTVRGAGYRLLAD